MIAKGITLASLLLLNPQWTIGSRGFNPSSGGGSGSVTYAPADFCDSGTQSGTSISCTTGIVTTGDALVISVLVGNYSYTTVTDSLGGTPTQFTGSPYLFTAGNITNDYWQMYCLPNVAAGTHTITFSQATAGEYPELVVIGWHGANATSPCTPTTISTATSSGSSAAMSAGPVTTTIANSAVIGVGFPFGGYPPTYGTGFTGITSPNAGYALEYAIETTPGSYTPTFTQSSGPWIETALVVHP